MADEAARLKIVIEAQDNASAVIDSVSQKVGNMNQNTKKGKEGMKALSKEMENAQKWQQTGKSIKEFGESIDAVTKPLQYAAAGSAATLVGVSKAAMDYETAFTAVKKTVDGTPQQLAEVDAGIRQLSKTIPMSASELAGLAATGGQLGVETGNILKFTETMAALGVATNLSGEEGAAAMARLMNVTGDSMDNIDRASSSVVALGNNTATSEAEIAAMAVRMGSYGQTVGMNTAQVLGYSAALSSMGVEAQAGGSALGRTWLDIETAVNSGGDALEAYAKYAGTSAQQFKEQWSTDPSGAFNGLIKGLSATEDLTGALSELGIDNTIDKQSVMKLANNYDLLAKCMNLSNDAYKENTALSEEANTAYQTTQNQLKLAMNSIQDAGIKWGEVLLPEIKSGAQWVGGLAQKFESLDDGAKKTVISGAKTAVVLGGISKAASGTIKGVGGIIESVGTIKKAISSSSTLSKIGPAMSSIVSAAGPAALAVGAVSAAVIIGKKAYDAYHESQINWGDTLREQSEVMNKHNSEYKQLVDFQKEIGELKLIINSEDSSAEEVEAAKQRIQEIAQLLKEEYNIDIKTDNSNLDETINKLDEAIKKQKELSGTESELEYSKTREYLAQNKGNYNSSPDSIQKAKTALEDGRQKAIAYNDALAEIKNAQADYNTAVSNGADKGEAFNKYLSVASQALEKTGIVTGVTAEKLSSSIDLLTLAAAKENEAVKYDENGNAIGKLAKDYEGLIQSAKDYEAARDSAINYGINKIADGNEAEGMKVLSEAVSEYGASASYSAMQVSAAKNDLSSFAELAGKSPEAFNKAVNDYRSAAHSLGASSEEIAVGETLIRNGFDSIQSAADAGALEAVSKQANELAHSLGLLPENQHIKINAEGDISVIDDTVKKVELLNGKTASVEINADGTPAMVVIDDVEYAISNYDGTNHTAVITAEDGASYTINLVTGEIHLIPQSHDTNITAIDNTGPGVASAKAKLNTVGNKTVTITVKTVLNDTAGAGAAFGKFGLSEGTQNFRGGLAMVNDQRGISDPRELVIDRGRAFIPQGRDVIIPLSKGAKVYTAAQTKRIMNNMGIPRYASGKNNSDAFTAAKDDWTHYTKTHAVTISKELEKWEEFSGKFTDNLKDAQDIEEEIYSLTVKQRDEINELSEDYINTRVFMNDWEAWGDSAIDAFGRVRDREMQYVNDGKITAKDAQKYIISLGEDMYDARMDNSKAWLEHEEKYNDMSVEDYILGIDRMREYTEEYYAQGMISAKTYYTSISKLADMTVDKEKEAKEADKKAAEAEVEAWKKSAEGYYEQRELYDDWESFSDSPTEFYKRCIQRQQEFFDAGKIGWEEYNENVIQYQMDLYRAQSDAYDELLDIQSAYIDRVDEQYNDLIRKKEDAFDMNKLTKNISDAEEKMRIYSGAVTTKGKEAYQDAQEQLEELRHEKEVKLLQKEQTEVVSQLRNDLERAESYKKPLLSRMRDAGINVEAISQNILENSLNMNGILHDLTSAIRQMEKIQSSPTTVYGPTNYNISGTDTGAVRSILLRGAAALRG